MKAQPLSRWSIATWPSCLVLLVVLSISVGCANKDELLLEAQSHNRELRQQLRQSQQRVESQEDTIRRQSEQINNLSKLGPERLEVLFRVAQIKLGRYSGGTELNKKPGDDGVRVYVIPQDEAGRTVTAAGSIEVNVFNLADKDESLLMSYSFSAVEAKKHWQSGGLANHYTITCPWKDKLPSGDEVTVRVKFIDYLTGQAFTATKQFRIRPPGAEQQPVAE